MNKGIILVNSDSESVESESKIGIGQSFHEHSIEKILTIEKYIRALENPRKNTDFCNICDSELKSFMHARTHYNSVKHIRKLELLREKLLESDTMWRKTEMSQWLYSNSSVLKEAETFYCKICDIKLGKLLIDMHFNEEEHKRNLETYCDICQVKTPSKEDLSTHKALFSHKLRLQQLTLTDIPVIPEVLVPLKSRAPLTLEDLTQNGEAQCVTFTCDDCDRSFDSEKLLLSHKQHFLHVAMEYLKSQYEIEIIKELCTITDDNTIQCLLCKVQMKSLADVKSHMNSTKHVKRFKNTFKDMLPEELSKTETEPNSTNNEKNINNNQEANDITKHSERNEKGKPKEEDAGEKKLYCFICKMAFESKSELSLHALSFPHVELAKLKSETVSLGAPYAEYWVQSDTYFCCTLCDAKFYSINTPKQHFQSAKHKERLVQWCKEFSTWKCGTVVDPKYFYCKTCDVPLVGTTEAELHYSLKSHLGREKFYCHVCNVASSTEKMFQEHNTSVLHQKNTMKGKKKEPDTKNPEDTSKHKEENTSVPIQTENPPSSDNYIKQQVYKELEKLIQTLYYSKSLPHDVVLEFLKNINKDISELEEKYQEFEKQRINGSLKMEKKEKQSAGTEESSINGQTEIPQISLPKPEDELGTETSALRRKRKKALLRMYHEDKANETNQGAILENELNISTKENEVVHKAETGKILREPVFLQSCETFEDLLNMVIVRRKEVSKFSNGNSVEVEVLNEMETLIRLIGSGEITPELLLGYLQGCNERIEKMVETNSKSNGHL